MMLAGPIVPTILALAMPNVLNVAMQSLVSIICRRSAGLMQS